MAILNPVVAYNAANNAEAHLLCNYLEQNGIEAHATFDESVVGLWAFGTLPEIHKPQIWVDKANVEAAVSLLAEYERGRSQRNAAERSDFTTGSIDAVCEECGQTSTFAASKNGTTQDCSHCGAYMDVGDLPFDEFDSGEFDS